MDHEDPRIDRSRGAVYQAEDSVSAVMRSSRRDVRIGRQVLHLPPELGFGSLEAIQSFVNAVLSEPTTSARYPGAGPVVVESRRGFRRATYLDGRIQIPAADPRGRWALTRSVVLHECAHHLSRAPGHGRRFREALVHLYRTHVGPAAATLLEHLLAPIDTVPEPATGDSGTRRVTALLAKAGSTSSAEESEAYLAKAALVAQKHSIDLAVAAWSSRDAAHEPTHRMLTIGRPRAALNKHLVSLLVSIARTWSVPVDIGHGSTYVLLYGTAGDLDQVESVFATASSLMVRRAHDHVRSGAWRGSVYLAGEPPRPLPVTATVARNGFCLGFTDRLGRRLTEVRLEARGACAPAPAEGDEPSGGVAGPSERVALALRARDLAVADYHRRTTRARGRWRGSATAASSATGSLRAGQRAAEEYGRSGLPGQRRAIEG